MINISHNYAKKVPLSWMPFVDYCPLVWHFCSKKLTNKMEWIQHRALQFLHNDYDSDYNTLLKKSDKCLVEVRRLRTMALELFKSLSDDLNTSFKKNLFNKRNNINRRTNDFIIHTRNSVTFGSEFEMLRTTYLENSSWKYERNNFEKNFKIY